MKGGYAKGERDTFKKSMVNMLTLLFYFLKELTDLYHNWAALTAELKINNNIFDD